MRTWFMYVKTQALGLSLAATDIDADTLDVLFEMYVQVEKVKDEMAEAKRKLKGKTGG